MKRLLLKEVQGFGRTFYVYHFLEVLFPIYLIGSTFWFDAVSGSNPGYTTLGNDIFFFFTAFLQIPLLGIVMYLIIRWAVSRNSETTFGAGKTDRRLALLSHFLPGILSCLFSAAVFAFYGRTLPEDSAFLQIRLLVYTIPTLLYLFLVFFAGFRTLEPYTEEFEKISQRIINGDYDSRITKTEIIEDGIFGPIAIFTNRILQELNETIGQINNTNENVNSVSHQLVEDIDELLSATREIRDATQSMADGAGSQAEMMAAITNRLDETRELLFEVTDDIQSKTDKVQQISLQTNILALNAGIEASRAGDYGRGFAVVAENVRRLSEEAKKVADQIQLTSTQINDFSTQSFSQMQDEIESVAAISEENSASTEEVAAIISEMSLKLENIETTSSKLRSQISTGLHASNARN